jgi:hypothetical protein
MIEILDPPLGGARDGCGGALEWPGRAGAQALRLGGGRTPRGFASGRALETACARIGRALEAAGERIRGRANFFLLFRNGEGGLGLASCSPSTRRLSGQTPVFQHYRLISPHTMHKSLSS